MRALLGQLFLYLTGIGRRLDQIDREVAPLKPLLERLISMSASLDAQLADLITLAEKQAADASKFEADVLTALAALQAGPLTAAQQAAIDNLRAVMTKTDTGITDADAALPAA